MLIALLLQLLCGFLKFQTLKLEGENLFATTCFSLGPAADHSSLIRPFLTLFFPSSCCSSGCHSPHESPADPGVCSHLTLGISPGNCRSAGQKPKPFSSSNNHAFPSRLTSLRFPVTQPCFCFTRPPAPATSHWWVRPVRPPSTSPVQASAGELPCSSCPSWTGLLQRRVVPSLSTGSLSMVSITCTVNHGPKILNGKF